jgi:hypothetical protein
MIRKYIKLFFVLGIFTSILIGFYKSEILSLQQIDKSVDRYIVKMAQRYREAGIIAYWSVDESIVVDDSTGKITVNDGTKLVPGRYVKGRKLYGPSDNTIIPHRLSFKELGRA